jgi:CBS domain-containing protein
MVKDVLVVDAKKSAKNSARMMSKFGVSSLMVYSENDIVGIVTERDIITRVVASGQDPDAVMVGEIMSEPIIVVNPNTPLEQAVQIMLSENIKKLPVVEKKSEKVELVGIISMTDVARIQPDLLEKFKQIAGVNEAIPELEFYIR